MNRDCLRFTGGLFLSLALAWPVSAQDWVWELPSHVPVPRVPEDNPMSTVKVELGRRLFYDPRLSADGNRSCASCHQQERAFTDAKALSEGGTGLLTHRNAPGLANSAWNAT